MRVTGPGRSPWPVIGSVAIAVIAIIAIYLIFLQGR